MRPWLGRFCTLEAEGRVVMWKSAAREPPRVGVISLRKPKKKGGPTLIIPHAEDETRFCIHEGRTAHHFKAASVAERAVWMRVLHRESLGGLMQMGSLSP